MINQSTKDVIITELNKQIAHVGSQNKLSTTLGVSGASISKIRNGKDGDIADGFWINLAAALKIRVDTQWMHADTVPYTKLTGYFADARKHANVFAMAANPGSGKTYTMARFQNNNTHVYSARCGYTTDIDPSSPI